MVGEGGTVIGPGDAVSYVPDRAFDRKQFAKMRARGIVHAPIAGHYWLDLPALKADEEARRRFLVPIVIASVLMIVAVLLFQYRG